MAAAGTQGRGISAENAQNSAHVTSARAAGTAAANQPAPNWRSPDATIKGKGGNASKKAQLEALRTQILSDYKTNTKDGEEALLLGPGLGR